MKAWDITRATIKAIRSGQYRFLRINYANGDMVGHTGQLDAAIRAVETMDECLAELLAVVQEQQGCLLVTADHGNCDEMIVRDKKTGVLTDRPSTRHSLAPVPLYLMGTPGSWSLREGGGLANLAATVTELLGYQAPVGYEPSLLIR
jgi:2,3-bisphosphoglycerate-independent phosphoglycerate mutase